MSHFHSSPATSATAATPLESTAPATTDNAKAYEAPAIESILTPDDLQREVLYAGLIQDGSAPTP